MPTNQLNLLITGLPRNFDKFIQNLSKIIDSSQITGKIVFSSWVNACTPNQIKQLTDLGVVLKFTEPPNPIGRGSIWAQIKSLENGLELFDSNDLILKMRTDVTLNPKHLFELVNYYNLNSTPEDTQIFSQKVLITGFEITKPFYIDDMVFMGLCQDLKQFISYDSSWDNAADGGGETHIRIFITPFIQKHPILNQYKLRLTEGGPTHHYIAPLSPQRFKLLEKRLTESEYKSYLALYYEILFKYFIVFNPKGFISHKHWYCNPGKDLTQEPYPHYYTSPSHSTGRNHIWCYSNDWAKPAYSKIIA